MLEIKDLCFSVKMENTGKPKNIINHLNLTVEDDKFVVITGPNGSGKTTLARLIMGIEKPTSGDILFNGTSIVDMPIHERAQLGIGYGFQQPARFKGMKVSKLLQIAAGGKLKRSQCNEY